MATEDQRQISELKSQVFKLQAELNFLYKHLGVTFVPEQNPNDDLDVVNFLTAGKVLNAIQAYRNKHNVDVDQAKAAVDQIRARLGV